MNEKNSEPRKERSIDRKKELRDKEKVRDEKKQ